MSDSIIDASTLEQDLDLEADVVIVGTGAGGGFAAETLAQAGLKVVMLEAGGYHRSSMFSQNEALAFPMLYQQSGAQRTRDQGIAIYQGNTVGGTTVVNWTSCFRTPERTLAHWAAQHDVTGLDAAALQPWFEAVEQRLNIHEWTEFAPNENNAILARGCEALGLEHGVMRRNVKGCANTGLCGLGCPIDAKQSMLVTTLPAAIAAGAILVHHARAETIRLAGARATGINAAALDASGLRRSGRRVTVRARHVIVAAGAIRSPGLLLRSKLPDPSGLTGKRTFLHPVSASLAVMPGQVAGYVGAPQSTYSDALLWPDDDRIGIKLETTPLQPMFALALFDKTFGPAHAAIAKRFDRMHSQVALLRDGFDERAPGGSVVLDDEGYESLDYPVSDYLREGFVRALDTMMAVQFAAGADYVLPWHVDARPLKSLDAARQWLAGASHATGAMQYGSAHVMGGCAMGGDPARSVVDANGAHHQIEALSVFDGSVFPTSIGANPQESIYALSLRNATRLAAQLRSA